MRPQENPLDLNNFPAEDYTKDGKQTSEDSSTSAVVAGSRKKKNGGKELGGDEAENNNNKVYECRFCSLKFCKSQALGGHMNRHRQERETETLNKARHLVFSNDLAPAGHLGNYVSSGQTIPHGGYHRQAAGTMGGSMYPTRLFSTSSPPPPPPPPPPYMYTAPPPMNDYFLGRNYTCIGAPVGHGFPNGGGNIHEEGGLNWGRR